VEEKVLSVSIDVIAGLKAVDATVSSLAARQAGV
jgi:hypothetical protein